MKNQTAKIGVESADFLQIIWKMFINSLTLRRNWHGERLPPKEIRRAEAIKKEYFKEKENKK